jgi:hypothetical protein
MGVIFITFRSVTPAQRGEAVLRKAGLRCALQRTPKWMEEQGCGYCLRLRQEEAPVAVNLLREAQVGFRKVYLQREKGNTEELAL